MSRVKPEVKQEVLPLNGDEAVAYAVKQADVDGVAAYPITPQTIIVERISEFVADGELDAEFVPVESEHSALSVCIGAAATGARTFTATASQGLALMWEVLYVASSMRLPIVMAVANRSLNSPLNIHCDHSDAMGARDAGWIQIFVENSQEAYDTEIQAYRIAEDERVLLPVMVNMDAFFLSHTLENVSTLPDQAVREFIGERRIPKTYVDYLGEVPYVLSPELPLTMGPVALPDYYFEAKLQQHVAMERSREVIEEVNQAYAELSGRLYGNGHLVTHFMEDADLALVVMGSTAGTARWVTKSLRRKGLKVGVVRLRTFRPFPKEELLKALKGVKAVGIMERNASGWGSVGGPVYLETLASLYGRLEIPVVNYVYGLGGRDASPKLIEEVIQDLSSVAKGESPSYIVKFMGVRE